MISTALYATILPSASRMLCSSVFASAAGTPIRTTITSSQSSPLSAAGNSTLTATPTPIRSPPSSSDTHTELAITFGRELASRTAK